MRVTPFIIFNRLMEDFHRSFRDLFSVQNKLSSGKKFSAPSDDVIGLSRAMDYRVSIDMNEQYKRNVDEAIAQISFTEKVMESVTATLTRARELAMEMGTDTKDAESRAVAASEVAQLKEHMLSLANSKFRDRYIFSGFKTDSVAFDTSGVYLGDDGVMNVMIDKDSKIAINIPGSTVFSYGGGTFFDVLDDLQTALENDDVDAIRSTLDTLDASLNQALSVRAELGSRLSSLEAQKNRLENDNLMLKTSLSKVEDADIVDAVSELAKTEIALQALRDTAGRIISQSLMDFLR
jgi:flagellar hook-associated protein 3 FlgL